MSDGASAAARRRGSVTAGVDLGGTKIQVVVVRAKHVVGSNRVPTPQAGAEAVTEAIVASVRAALADAGSDVAGLRAIGVGTPGTIDPDGGVSNSPNVPGFEGSDPIALGRSIASALRGVPVTVDNDVRVGIVGEVHRGAGRPFATSLGVFCGTGVGGGLVLDGKLQEGRGAAGEIGHTLVKDGGRRCGCGKRGHLEAYAGRKSIELEARRRVKRGAKSDLIARALEEADPLTVELIDQAVWALGIALSNAQNLLDLDAIIVGGGLGDRLGRPFVDRIADAMRPRLHVPERPPAVLPTELGDLSGAVGAAVRAGG
jgi:glucokinase